jgi:hypothetical protein
MHNDTYKDTPLYVDVPDPLADHDTSLKKKQTENTTCLIQFLELSPGMNLSILLQLNINIYYLKQLLRACMRACSCS